MRSTPPRLRARSLAILLGTAAFAATPAVAEQGPSEPVNFDIAAQPLDQAVTALARQAGLSIGGDASLLRGKQAAALEGEYTVDEALQRLLAGAGLQYRFSDGDRVTLSAEVERESESAAMSEMEPLVVSATRTDTPVSELSRSVTVIDEQQIQQQAGLDANLGTILSNTVPGFGPSTEAASNLGQSLRGRNLLVLIDGIPQSTPLNDGFRDLNTIAPSSIERIEVVRGGTAVYGFGAAGGLINVITKKPSSEPLAGYSQAGASFNTEETDDSGIYETEQRVSGTRGAFDYVVSGSVISRNGFFDSEGRRIPPNPNGAQGGFSDTDQGSLLAKAGYALGGDQRLQVMLNHYEFEQDSDYTFGAAPFTLDQDPLPNSRRTPAIKVSDASTTSARFEPQTENTTASLTYTNADLMGSRIRVNTFYNDQTVIFPLFPGFRQSETVSEKFGSRATVTTPMHIAGIDSSVTWGADYLGDETDGDRLGPGADFVPKLDQDAVAAFAQVEVPAGDAGLVRTGLRHEVIEVDTDRVDSNRNGNAVTSGTLDYDETLFNLSGVWFVSESVEVFGGFSQGFSLASLGRVIRDAGSFGGPSRTFDVEQFEEDAEKVDNYELGVRTFAGRLEASAAAFYSESDNGTTFDDDLNIQKFSEEIYGIEASVDYRVSDAAKIGGTLSYSEGEQDSTSGTQDLPNTRIAPEKLTAYVEHAITPRWNNRLQLQAIGHREPDRDAASEVDGYELVDLVSTYRIGPGNVRVSISNLFNENYFPAINQALNFNGALSKGPGRRLGVSYAVKW